jgi:hypothetical protein
MFSFATRRPQHQQLNVLGNWRAAKQGKPAAEPDKMRYSRRRNTVDHRLPLPWTLVHRCSSGGGRLSGTPQVYGVLHGLVLSVRRGNGI